MKKILIGTHNKGKFKEIAYLIPKNIKKFHQYRLKLKAQRKQENLLFQTLDLKLNFFLKFVDFPLYQMTQGCVLKL